jgi:predicted  nucleic acid-binding Zn-ribbon protein
MPSRAAAWRALVAACAVLAAVPVWAQSAKSTGPGDKVMSREELRACLKEGDTLKSRNGEFERGRKDLDAEKARLFEEREALDKEVQAMSAERSKVDTADEAAVKAYNEKANAAIASYNTKKPEVDAKIDAWNAKNRSFNERAVAHDQQMKAWNDGCGSRRYREDDEKAIRAGK